MKGFDWNAAVNVTGYIALVAGSVLALMSRLPKQTIENQSKLIEALNGRILSLENQREEDRQQLFDNQKQMGILQGQVETYRSLPLVKMANDMSQIAATNTEILATLRSSAITLAQTETDKTARTATVSATLATQ